MWTDRVADVLSIAYGYWQARQYADARVEFLKAATLARQRAWRDVETNCLEGAWDCLRREHATDRLVHPYRRPHD